MRLPKTFLITFFMTIGLVAFSQNATDYKVYSVVLTEFLKIDKGLRNLVLIIHESDSTLFDDYENPELMGRLDSVMKKQMFFENKFKIKGYKTKVITTQEFYSLIYDDNHDLGWEPLYKKYPKAEGVISLSPILYTNEDKSKGIVQVLMSRGSLSAGGYIVTFDLTKKREKRITRKLTIAS